MTLTHTHTHTHRRTNTCTQTHTQIQTHRYRHSDIPTHTRTHLHKDTHTDTYAHRHAHRHTHRDTVVTQYLTCWYEEHEVSWCASACACLWEAGMITTGRFHNHDKGMNYHMNYGNSNEIGEEDKFCLRCNLSGHECNLLQVH